ncbi:hypothetical protein GOP47_0005508 [Adiantum capillus-veneris]|uniref:Uncharacterized protein n=1 Tax=Adiantum capillus-veneris TaxID=13818 RepID=A0A9D4V5P1_ADICA|nr:hypothetical protein GOP47_0005508 [Adiantum capillus-veneris]
MEHRIRDVNDDEDEDDIAPGQDKGTREGQTDKKDDTMINPLHLLKHQGQPLVGIQWVPHKEKRKLVTSL